MLSCTPRISSIASTDSFFILSKKGNTYRSAFILGWMGVSVVLMTWWESYSVSPAISYCVWQLVGFMRLLSLQELQTCQRTKPGRELLWCVTLFKLPSGSFFLCFFSPKLPNGLPTWQIGHFLGKTPEPLVWTWSPYRCFFRTGSRHLMATLPFGAEDGCQSDVCARQVSLLPQSHTSSSGWVSSCLEFLLNSLGMLPSFLVTFLGGNPFPLGGCFIEKLSG